MGKARPRRATRSRAYDKWWARFAYPPCGFDFASVRIAITSASTSSAAASRNGAPGSFNGALAPMK